MSITKKAVKKEDLKQIQHKNTMETETIKNAVSEKSQRFRVNHLESEKGADVKLF